MKKYLFGLTAVVCALVLSAFAKPYSIMTFKLKYNPRAGGIVSDPASWTNGSSGLLFGACSGPNADLACTILLDDSRTSYFHTVGTSEILNSFTYADAQSPKQDYLQIGEMHGLGFDYIITYIIAKHYNTWTMEYENDFLAFDLSYTNAQEVDE